MINFNEVNTSLEIISKEEQRIKSIRNTLKKIKKILRKVKRRLKTGIKIINFFIISKVLSIFLKLKDNKVLFLSDVRNVLDGNLKFVYNYIDDNKFEKVLSLKSDRKEKRNIKQKIKLLYNIVTSKYIILDDYSRFISIIKVRKGQEICQLWHGAGAFKKFGYSRQDKNKTDKINGHRNYTKVAVTADDIRWCYAEGFGVNIDKVKATGMARTDIFFDKENIERKRNEIYQEYPYLKGKKVILFAPTYRGKSLKKSYYDYEKLDVDKIYKELKEENYIFIFKWHPGLYYQMKVNNLYPYQLENYENFFYDFSDKRDINDLLLVTDVLITDYSSVIFDYALLNKPLVYFTYDYEEYNEDRGLYFEFEDYVYGNVAKNTLELINAVKKEEMLEEKRKKFIRKFMSACDGQSTKKTCKWIFGENI